ncbi:sugar phosphate isomerase/epimerase family protein [Phytomonospora endophytica]|uniref:Sugar phosphate isomerase/epimerase n=1 Tax=Phytomonospora endophytica TaxID=714109 RepID=A0A841FP43_9ACTN|nr:sugar phosphate isomerase/epimerase [Phytomonospora endophytica]MBB6037875.1 sugar phosphate isomerase/epimerase [Phytomonospora endophytica]GIG68774.1 sugar phosphate isomerase [Phytomonospora endophytica]
MSRIGVQAFTLRAEFARLGVFETFRRVAAIGYRSAEISAIPMTPGNVAELVRVREELGVDIVSLSGGLTGEVSLTTAFDEFVADATTLGASRIRIGMLPAEAMATPATVAAFADGCNAVAERLAEHGISLHYHNHHVDFAAYDGRHLLDVIAERSPLVGLEIDAHWVQRGGLDPVRTLHRYAGRVAMVHLKDYRIARLDPAVFAALDDGDRAPWQEGMAQIVQFAEVGEGNLDWPAIIAAADETGVAHLLVEQDEFYGRTAFDCLRTSYDNLVAMGYGDRF